MTKVKTCGIHSVAEAEHALASGADFLGLLVEVPLTHLSVSVADAESMVREVPDAKWILLLASSRLEKNLPIIERIRPWGVQLLRPTEFLVEGLKKRSSAKIMPVISVTGEEAVEKALRYSSLADYLLLDSREGDRLGGTGKVHDWTISKTIVEKSTTPIFLAGGLNSDNVVEAIKLVRPFAVDVDSSLRNDHGFRDPERLAAFVKTVKTLNGQ